MSTPTSVRGRTSQMAKAVTIPGPFTHSIYIEGIPHSVWTRARLYAILSRMPFKEFVFRSLARCHPASNEGCPPECILNRPDTGQAHIDGSAPQGPHWQSYRRGGVEEDETEFAQETEPEPCPWDGWNYWHELLNSDNPLLQEFTEAEGEELDREIERRVRSYLQSGFATLAGYREALLNPDKPLHLFGPAQCQRHVPTAGAAQKQPRDTSEGTGASTGENGYALAQQLLGQFMMANQDLFRWLPTPIQERFIENLRSFFQEEIPAAGGEGLAPHPGKVVLGKQLPLPTRMPSESGG